MPYSPTPDQETFVKNLPKTETHLHLEGALPINLLRDAFPGEYEETPPMWSDDFRFSSFDQFMELFEKYLRPYFATPDRYHSAAKVVLQDCVDQGCKYVETSIHLPGVYFNGLNLDDVMQAIRSAAPEGLHLRTFVGMPHYGYTPELKPLVDEAIECEFIDGIDLHAEEYAPMEPWTAIIWEKARANGKFTKAHAGEFMPASYVEWVLDNLKVNRIEHGVRSIEDPELVKRLAAEGVTLDVCPLSNVKLAVEGITCIADHPFKKLMDADVKVTLNSDDPFMFGNTLSEDYYAVMQDLGLTKTEIVQVARNGFDIALMEDAEKKPFYDELNAIEAGL